MQTASNQQRYLARSFKMLTQMGPKWIVHVLVLSLLQIIPIFGQICLLGYAYLWSNRTAWGMEGAPDAGGIDIGKIVSHGAKVFVPFIVWTIAIGILSQLIGFVGMIPVIGWIILIIYMIGQLFLNILIFVACQRSSIYELIVPGFQLDKIFDMCQRDWNGLLRIFGFYLLMSVLTSVVTALILVPPFVVGITAAAAATTITSEAQVMAMMISVISAMIGNVIFGVAIALIISVFTMLLMINMVGIWTSQFYPETWGPYTEPIPRQPRQMYYMNQQQVYTQPPVQAESVYGGQAPAQSAPEHDTTTQVAPVQHEVQTPTPSESVVETQSGDSVVQEAGQSFDNSANDTVVDSEQGVTDQAVAEQDLVDQAEAEQGEVLPHQADADVQHHDSDKPSIKHDDDKKGIQ